MKAKFAIRVATAPDHSKYAAGKLLRSRDGVALRFDKPKTWATAEGAKKNVPTSWGAGWAFEVISLEV